MPRRTDEPAGITFRAEYEPDMERMVQACGLCWKRRGGCSSLMAGRKMLVLPS